ncbi:MAG: BACON domain-containing carbohydrate-binding protein [Pseudomonadota bacterium]
MLAEDLTNNANATIDGGGVITGSVYNNGIIAPGIGTASFGQINFNNGLNSASNAVLNIEIGNSTNFDKIVVTGAINLAGTLNITLVNGYNPTANTIFNIISYGSANGDFLTKNLPTLSSGLSWQATKQANTYELKVVGDPPQNIAKIGVIRWDLWQESSETNKTLGPNIYHSRLPFFGRETTASTVSISGGNQGAIDQEIAYAREAGISFFAFYWYFRWPNLSVDSPGNQFYARELFKLSNSPNKEYVKAAYILWVGAISSDDWNNSNSIPLTQIGDDMLRSDYHKVNIGGILRPLLFYHSATGHSEDLITTTQRTNLVKAYRRNNPNAPDPYIVNLVETDGAYAKMSTGASRGQAMSQYVTTGGSSTTHNYNEIISSDIEAWNRYKNADCKVIPIVTVGFDRRPRIDNHVSWEDPTNQNWTAMATNAQLHSHLQEAITFVNSNPIQCETNTILCYAWNEHDEGGYICPTIIPDGNYNIHTYQIDRSKLDVVKSLFNPNGTTPISLTLNPTNVSISATAASNQTFSVNSNTAWTTSTTDSWITGLTASGSNNGTIAFNVSANTTTTPRAGIIKINYGSNQFQSFTVNQAGVATSNCLNISNISFGAAQTNPNINGGNPFKIVYWTLAGGTPNANGKYRLTLNSDLTGGWEGSGTDIYLYAGSDWTIYIIDGASKVGVLRLVYNTNQATIIPCGGGASLTLNPTNVSISATAASNQTFSVNSNTAWTTSTTDSWITGLTASGSNNGTIAFNVSANTTTTPRAGIIKINYGSNQFQSFTVNQAGVATSNCLNISNISFGAAQTNPNINGGNPFKIVYWTLAGGTPNANGKYRLTLNSDLTGGWEGSGTDIYLYAGSDWTIYIIDGASKVGVLRLVYNTNQATIIPCGGAKLAASIEEENTSDQNYFDVAVLPNPTSGEFLISSNNNILSCFITSESGKILFIEKFKGKNIKEKIDISHLNNGLYILRINTGKRIFFKKIIKQ